MSTEIGGIIFETKKTLFEVLDELDVPTVSTLLNQTNNRLDQVNDQLRQLGLIVDSNQQHVTAEFINANTRIDGMEQQVSQLASSLAPLISQMDNLNILIFQLSSQIETVEVQTNALLAQVSSLSVAVSDMSSSITSLTARVNNSDSRIGVVESQLATVNTRLDVMSPIVTFLDSNRARLNLIFRSNTYFFTYRIGNPGTTYSYRITYTGLPTSVVYANVGHTCQVLSSIDGTLSSRAVYLTAPFDAFSAVGRINYPLVQGPCLLSFTVNNNNPILGYITPI